MRPASLNSWSLLFVIRAPIVTVVVPLSSGGGAVGPGGGAVGPGGGAVGGPIAMLVEPPSDMFDSRPGRVRLALLPARSRTVVALSGRVSASLLA